MGKRIFSETDGVVEIEAGVYAEAMGPISCWVLDEEGRFVGFNTDFQDAVKQAQKDVLGSLDRLMFDVIHG